MIPRPKNEHNYEALDERFNLVPAEMREQDQWVVWAWQEASKGDSTKVPGDPKTGTNIDDKDPANWISFEQAAANAGRQGGVAFCFGKRDPYCGADLDDCRDPATGEIEPWAWEIIRELDSYTEISPSGTGVKVYCRGILLRSGKRGNIEMYDHKRMFCVTGQHLEGTPTTLNSPQEELVALNRRIWPEGEIEGVYDIPDPVSPALDDSEVLEKVRKSKVSERFERLWTGNTSDHGSDHSSADLALVNLLAFYTQDDVQLNRLFRQSGLMRPKWDERHRGDGANYGVMTVEKALAGRKPEDCWMGAAKKKVVDEDRRGRRDRILGERRDILKIIREGITPPEPLAPSLEDLLFKQQIHTLFGDAESGKSMVAVWAAARVMASEAGGRVIYLDVETGEETLAERIEGFAVADREYGNGELAALLDGDTLNERFHYFNPKTLGVGDDSRQVLEELVEDVEPALVIFDSWVGFLAHAGFSENDNTEVSEWTKKIAYPVRQAGGAVVILDHVSHEKRQRGAKAKKGEVDVSYEVRKTKDFDRDALGGLRLTNDKKRRGVGADRVDLTIGGDGKGGILCYRGGTASLTDNQRKLYAVLPEGGLTSTDWMRASGSSESAFHRNKNALAEQGAVRKTDDGRFKPTWGMTIGDNEEESG